MTTTGFEPAKHYAPELESGPFDRSGTLSWATNMCPHPPPPPQTPGETRTRNLWIRSPTRYPIAPRGQLIFKVHHHSFECAKFSQLMKSTHPPPSSGTGTRTRESCVKSKYDNHLHHTGKRFLQCPTTLICSRRYCSFLESNQG